jgi:thiamine biosynthesis protein ThiS
VLEVTLNGQTRNFAALEPGAGLDAVVVELALAGDRVAVELNGEIVSRSQWPETKINNGDKLEVVHFVGGGKSESIYF